MKARLPKMVEYDYMSEKVTFYDLLALMVLHTEFGFGADRLRRYYRAIYAMSEEYKRRFADPATPAWGKKDRHGFGRMEVWALKRDLAEIGFDYDAMLNEPVPAENAQEGGK